MTGLGEEDLVHVPSCHGNNGNTSRQSILTYFDFVHRCFRQSSDELTRWFQRRSLKI